MVYGGAPFPSAAAAACLLLLAVTASALAASPAPAQVYVVGGEPRGWRKPAPNDETYNHWAARNRFRIGDFIQFKYDKNDSVLVVSRDDYKLCGGAKPAQRLEGGDTRFRLDHSGFYYFLSGAPGHCEAGQRMALRVMVSQPPAPAPAALSPDDGRDDGGFTGGSKPWPGAGGSVSISKPPPPPEANSHGGDGAKSGAAASVRPPSLFTGYHHVVVVAGTVMLMCLAP